MTTNKHPYQIPIYKLQLVQEGTAKASPLSTPSEVAGYLSDLASSDREQVIAIYLNTKNTPMARHTVSIGTIDSSFLQGREVFKAALLANAAKLVLAHNAIEADVEVAVVVVVVVVAAATTDGKYHFSQTNRIHAIKQIGELGKQTFSNSPILF